MLQAMKPQRCCPTCRLTLLRHARNKGKGAALVTGFGEALRRNVCAVITLDGDGQHRPEDIPRFLTRARQAPSKIIVGSRIADKAGLSPLALPGQSRG